MKNSVGVYGVGGEGNCVVTSNFSVVGWQDKVIFPPAEASTRHQNQHCVRHVKRGWDVFKGWVGLTRTL